MGKNLKAMDLTGCSELRVVPDLSASKQLRVEGVPVWLERWTHGRHQGGYARVNPAAHNTVETLRNFLGSIFTEHERVSSDLVSLDLSKLDRLDSFPTEIGNFKMLQMLDMAGCCSVKQLPDVLGRLDSLEVLRLRHCTALERLPAKLKELENLKAMDLTGCSELRVVPDLSASKQLR